MSARVYRLPGTAEDLVLPPLEAFDACPAEQLPGMLAHLLALQARLVARMVTVSTSPTPGPDRLLTVQAAAAQLGMSVDWLYRHADALPFTRRTGRRTLRFSEQALRRYLAEQA